MSIGVLALVGLAPERVASLTAAGYTYCISRRNLRGGIHLRVR